MCVCERIIPIVSSRSFPHPVPVIVHVQCPSKPGLTMKTRISSFAVLDLETTSLPDLNFNKTSITEISIHAFNSEDVKNSSNCKSPRINHKLTLLFNPRSVVHPDSEKITGLDNYMLEDESPLNSNAANVIVNFLGHLRSPVCLVAHNGNKFDFPVLKHALSNTGVELPSSILCIDSYVAIKDLEMAMEAEKEESSFVIIPPNEFDLPEKSNEPTTPLKNDESIKELLEEIPIKSLETLEKNESPINWQTFNETTPHRPPNVENIGRKRKKLASTEASTPSSNEPKSRRSLFSPIRTKPGHYKLGTIYERLFGNRPEEAHHAEADVITLEKIILGLGQEFVHYAEENAKPFGEVKKLGAK